MDAFHSTKNSVLNFRNFRMSNGTVFSTRPDRSRSFLAPPRITRENAEGSRWSGCLKCCKLLYVEKFNTHSEFNSSLIFIWEKLTNFSRGRVCKPGELTHRKFGTTSPQFCKKSDPNVFVFDQEQARTMADHFASTVVSTRKTRRHLVAFHDWRNWGRFKPGRNAKWNRKFPEIPNFQKKGQPREVNRNFRNKFSENFCSISF